MSAPMPAGTDGDDLGPSRWRGQPDRLEVWYATATDDTTGAGLWLHHELVAPVEGSDRQPYAHGWVAWFPADGSPVCERFGPVPVAPGGVGRGPIWFAAATTEVSADRMAGDIGTAWWDLATTAAGDQAPLWTFPRAAWEREVLPAAQVVATPSLRMDGRVTLHGVEHRFAGNGALARIYGHGNAARWGWLHADLGSGDMVEIVAAVSRRPVLKWLPPVPFVRFRLGGRDLPAVPVAAARTVLALPQWSVRGWLGRRRLEVDVEIAPDRAVALGYEDPDGATATCTNSERAVATVRLGDRRWRLDGTAHAEVGLRP